MGLGEAEGSGMFGDGMGRLVYKVMIVEPRKRLESVKLVKEYISVYALIKTHRSHMRN